MSDRKELDSVKIGKVIEGLKSCIAAKTCEDTECAYKAPENAAPIS